MLVKELIKTLETLDPETKVVIEDDESICEAHAIALGENSVHILWRQKDLCNCLGCRNDFGFRDVIFNEECKACEEADTEHYFEEEE